MLFLTGRTSEELRVRPVESQEGLQPLLLPQQQPGQFEPPDSAVALTEMLTDHVCLAGDVQLGVRLRSEERLFLVRWRPACRRPVFRSCFSSLSFSSVRTRKISLKEPNFYLHTRWVYRKSSPFDLQRSSFFTAFFRSQILILSLRDLSAFSHLVVSASNINGKQVSEQIPVQHRENLIYHPVRYIFSVGVTTQS